MDQQHQSASNNGGASPNKQTITKQEVEQGKGMAILAYIIALIPYFTEKNNKFVRFHAIQGMNILIYCVIWSVIAGILASILVNVFVSGCWSWALNGGGGMCNWTLYRIVSFVIWAPSIVIGIIDIIGLVGAANGQIKKVPLFDKLPKIISK